MDSPAGLAGWIVEKWRRWSDCDGDVQQLFTRDELLTTIAIYWFTRHHQQRQPPLLREPPRPRRPRGRPARAPTRRLPPRAPGRRRHAEHRASSSFPSRVDLRRATVDRARPRVCTSRPPRPPSSTWRSCGRSSVISAEPGAAHLTTCQNGAMTTATTIDLLDLDRFQRLEHHEMFKRLRAEDPVSWHDYPGEPGLLERRPPRGPPHRQPRHRALLVRERGRDAS